MACIAFIRVYMTRAFSFIFCVQSLLLTAQLYAQGVTPPPALKKEQPKNLSINSRYNEYMPFISPDNEMLFFQSDRPDNALESSASDIWVSYRDRSLFGEVVFLPPQNLGTPINTKYLEGMSSIRPGSNRGLHLYFTSVLSAERNGVGETDIFHSFLDLENFVWSEPAPVEGINTLFHDRMPYISSDGLSLFFSSNRPGGYGGEDIWLSRYDKEKNRWGTPENAGGMINTKYDETSPAIHKNKVSLYFSSNRLGGEGGFDIYLSQDRALEPGAAGWRRPKNLGEPYNSRYDEEGISLSGDGEYIYFSSNRVRGEGLYDIYRQKLKFEFRAPLPVVFMGNVYIEGTRKGIEANVQISNRGREHNLATGKTKGNFSVQLQSNDVYYVQVSAPGYQTHEYQLNLKDVLEQNEKREKIFFLKKVKVKNKQETPMTKTNLPEKLVRIFYFAVNVSSIEGIDDEIKKMQALWEKNKDKIIVVRGHSGREGNQKKRNELSKERSSFIRSKLEKMGVPAKSLVNEWHAFSRPVSLENDGASRSKNRRVEVYVK